MKLLYDHQIFVAQKFGGISRYFNELMQADYPNFSFDKIDPDLFITKNNSVNKEDLISRGLRYVKKKTSISKTDEQHIALPQEALSVLSGNDFDLFHPTYYDPYFLKISDKPFVLTVYDMIHEIYKEYFPVNDITSHNKKLLCEKANHIIAISERTKEDLISIFRVPEEKITTILLASNFDKAVPKKPETIGEVENFILFVGSRGLYKNFYFPIIALSKILRNDKTINVLCSGVPFTVDELHFFKDYQIDKQMHHVYLIGDDELAWAYSNALFFIFPSLYEGFGFPILEAFACNCPVISSTGGSLPEVAGNAALYFDPKSYQEISDAANSILYNSDLRSSLINSGQKQLKLFTWEKCRQQTFNIYKKLA